MGKLYLGVALTACGAEGTQSAPPIPSAGDPATPEVIPDAPSPVPLELTDLECGETASAPSEGRLLTRLQYQNTINDLFHTTVAGEWVKDFPAENEVLGYRTNAQFHRATPWLVEAQLVSSEAVAADVAMRLASLLPCSQHVAEDAAIAQSCAQEFIETYVTRGFRRPLQDEERAVFVHAFDAAFQAAGFVDGIEVVVEVLLQSPQFLYRWERNTTLPIVQNQAAEPSSLQVYALDDFELAARLSYLVWNSLPDVELWERAEAGELRDPSVLRLQAERMLDSPRAVSTVADFTEQWLGLAALGSAVRRVGSQVAEDGTTVPLVNTQYSSAWQQSIQAFMAHLITNDGNFAELFRSPRVFVNQALWDLYPTVGGFSDPPETFVGLDYPLEERAGLLTQPALMALLSHSDQSAPILRGVFVRDVLLCDPPPAPPPTVNPTPPALDPNATTRERFAQHTESASCSGCHQLIDPIGLGLENYDELGRFRADENGLQLDVSGEINHAAEPSLNGPFTGARELSERLAQSSHVQACFITHWYRYGMGRVEQEVDLCSIRQVYDHFIASDGSVKSILLGLIASDAFRFRSVAADDPAMGEEAESL